MNPRDINDLWQDPAAPSFLIAEVAQAHDGSLGTAHAYIDAVAKTGADAIKFQTHIAAEESSELDTWRVKFSRQDATRYDYWKRMEFTAEQWAGLKQHAEEKGLVFLSSPFSLAAIDLLERLGVTAWKVASGEVTNRLFLDAMIATRKPVLVSSGMSYLEEMDATVALLKAAGSPAAVFQCTTAYPCPPEKIGLNQVSELMQRYDCPIGLSDHSGTSYPSLAAVTLGARLIEVHITFSREMFGPDVSASLTTDEFAKMVEGIRFIERMKASPMVKDASAEQMEPLRRMFGQSLVAATDLAAGTALTRDNLSCRKPGHGISAANLESVIGRTLKHAVKAAHFLSLDDFQ
ncbi:MAG: N-acetylneuraminate synthase family protein [Prosthecobacter sp.]|uniref:N-acetylneuraminate synthase family protein n=1 Tax=Prosthecobacter sp. TaxID=1965333 RepID=UPI001A0CABB3|nr:N-acetylneuraminate synthase family protein [Prosthecobacter sp.]MBE2285087.1 N-acetylneuraminate synthase family protein [Prosthecobacter sp.]